MAGSTSPVSRRAFLGTAGALVAPPFLRDAQAQPAVVVNDLHSQLNETRVRRILTPRTADEVQAAVRAAASEGVGCRSAAAGMRWAASSSGPTRSLSICDR